MDESPVPNDMAYFINDTVGNTIFGENAYAESIFGGENGQGFRAGVFAMWKTSRNIAVSLMVLFVGIVGIMVMVRHKINPNVVASLYNTLPYIPIAVGFILLSYPIVTFILSSVWSLSKFAIWMAVVNGSSFANGIAGLDANSNWYDYMAVGFNNFIRIFNPVNWVSYVFLLMALLAVMFTLFLTLFKILAIYIRFIWYTIVSPFVGLAFMLPGNQGVLVHFLKKIVVDIVSIPIMLFTVFFGLMIVASGSVATSAGDGFLGSLFFEALGLNFFWSLARVMLGIIIIWQGRKVGSILRDSLGIQKGIFYNPKQRH